MRDETTKDNRQTTALISHDLTRNNELAFSSTSNLQFYCFQIVKFFFFDFGFGIPKEKIRMTFDGKAILNQDNTISRSDTARQRVWEWEKMSQSQAIFLCIGFKCSSNGHASWLWLVVFNPYFFCSWETFTQLYRCKFSQFALTFRSI